MSETRAAHLLGKLAGKTQSFSLAPGGRNGLDAMDVAAGCAGMDALSYMLVRACYSMDEDALKSAYELAYHRYKDEAQLLINVSRESGISLAAQAVIETVSPRKCKKCKGRGQVMSGAKVNACTRCSGSGVQYRSANAKAKDAGIPESTWRKHQMEDRYIWLMQQLERLVQQGLKHLSDKVA